jgi:hypothetical protein
MRGWMAFIPQTDLPVLPIPPPQPSLILREVKGVEIENVLECAAGAAAELDGERLAVGPGSAVLIPPGYVTRSAGAQTRINERTDDSYTDSQTSIFCRAIALFSP